MIKPSWVKYRGMGGPLYRGAGRGRNKIYTYDPKRPWGVWSQVLGVVAKSEGAHDTVVMYDETGVTFGFLQWTFKSGRLQNLLQFMKGVPSIGYPGASVFAVHFTDDSYKRQVFEKFGFRIENGCFVLNGKRLYPTSKKEQRMIVNACMGRHLVGKEQRRFALDLCAEFARLGQIKEVQDAVVEFAKVEFKRALEARRKPLSNVGWTIRCLLPNSVWGGPIPAIFFNLYQNSPAGAFNMFKRLWKAAEKKGLAFFVHDGDDPGYELTNDSRHDEVLELLWSRLNRTKYADWGFGSRQYIESGGRNPPRITRIRPAIRDYYGVDLAYERVT